MRYGRRRLVVAVFVAALTAAAASAGGRRAPQAVTVYYTQIARPAPAPAPFPVVMPAVGTLTLPPAGTHQAVYRPDWSAPPLPCANGRCPTIPPTSLPTGR